MIYIIRHGKTAMNQANVLQGRSDCPLSEEGVRQAEEAAKRLRGIRFSYVFSSPLIRAVQTARIVAPCVSPKLDDRLIEMDYGPYEGVSLDHMPPEILTFFSDFIRNPAPQGMEPLADVVKRAGAFLEEIRFLPGDILISTHAIAMKGLLEYLTPDAQGAFWGKYIGNCAIYAVENQYGKYCMAKELRSGEEAKKTRGE
ncbi:MAG: histidine phosphatase family protein [Clostridia bacterium]|nr:histidine phosphatase family protein [Clostridia bacterium]